MEKRMLTEAILNLDAGSASLALCLTLLIAVSANKLGLRVGQESLPEKVLQLFRAVIEDTQYNQPSSPRLLVIMRSLKRSSSSAMPGMSVRLDVQQQATLRYLLHFALERHLGYLIQMQMLRCHSSHTFI